MRSGGLSAVEEFLPRACAKAMRELTEAGEAPIDDRKLESMMLGVLRRLKANELLSLPDLSEGIENRIDAAIRQACAIDEVYALSKSKRYTASRIRRLIMAAFLGLSDNMGVMDVPYIRVLGFNEKGKEVLALMRKTAKLPVSDSLAYLRKQGDAAAAMVDCEASSTDLYTLGLPVVRPCGYDFTAQSARIL